MFFAEQAAAFARRGHSVAIASCSIRSLRSGQWRSPFNVSNDELLTNDVKARVYRKGIPAVPTRMVGESLADRWLTGSYERFLKQVIDHFGTPDLVHIQSAAYAGAFSFEWLKKHSIPYIITEHASFYQRGLVPEHRMKLIRQTFDGASAAFAVSSSLRSVLQQCSIEAPIKILGNTYDDQLFQLSKLHCKKPLTFLIVCGLTRNKRVDLAINAFHQLLQSDPACRLRIAGAGKEQSALRHQVTSLGLNDTIQFEGNCSRPEVAELMKSSHCLLSTSEAETFGVTLIEAMATGLPVIATRSGGPEDFVISPHGQLVDKESPQDLLESMKRVVNGSGDSITEAAKRHLYVRKNYSPAAFYEKLLPHYQTASRSRFRFRSAG